MSVIPVTDSIARPGDLFLEHDTDAIDRVIQFGERLRGQKSWANHGGIFIPDLNPVDATSHTVAEATAKGIVTDAFPGTGRGLTRVVPVEPLEARERVVQFALAHVGDTYGWWEISSIVVTVLTGTRLRVGKAGTYICSGYQAAALDFASIRVQDYPEWTLPSQLDVPEFRADPLAVYRATLLRALP